MSRAGSLSGAARTLGVNQSTVGRRLLALDASLGVRLFDRTPEGYVLTAAGESVRAEAERLEETVLGIERKLTGRDARVSGVVRLATTELIATVFLIPNVARLRATYPDVSVELITGSPTVDLARREADLAVRIGPPPKQPNLIAVEIGTLYSALYAAPSYLTARRGLRLRRGLHGHSVVGISGPLATSGLARWFEAHAREANVVFKASSVHGLRDAVAAGLGIGILPCALAEHRLTRVPIGTPLASPIWTVVHEDLNRSARVRAVLEFMRAVIRDSEWIKPPRVTARRGLSRSDSRRRARAAVSRPQPA